MSVCVFAAACTSAVFDDLCSVCVCVCVCVCLIGHVRARAHSLLSGIARVLAVNHVVLDAGARLAAAEARLAAPLDVYDDRRRQGAWVAALHVVSESLPHQRAKNELFDLVSLPVPVLGTCQTKVNSKSRLFWP